MSHWSQGQTRITDLSLLKRIAEEKGVEVREGEDLKLNSYYAGSVAAVMLLLKDGGSAGVVPVEKGKEEYAIQLDNWANPITRTIGNNGDILCRDYMVEKAKAEAIMMGGMLVSQEVCADGYVELVINI